MPEFQNWQHSSLVNQLVANIKPTMVDGYYRLEMRLTARQCDQLEALAGVFDSLARAEGGPPPTQDKGGD